jgi:hypothetical protein
MAVATPEQVEASLGRSLTNPETVQVSQWLDDAELQIRLRLGAIADLDQEAVAYVERESVILKLQNPEGKQQEAIDDYSYRRYDANARGQVFIIDDWWDILSPTSSPSAFSFRPTFETDDAQWSSRNGSDYAAGIDAYGWPVP